MARDGRQYNLEEVDSYGNTALLKACYLGRFDCARTLLEFGGNIFAMNYFGQNALTLASYEDLEVVDQKKEQHQRPIAHRIVAPLQQENHKHGGNG